jgi:hypothetical protein
MAGCSIGETVARTKAALPSLSCITLSKTTPVPVITRLSARQTAQDFSSRGRRNRIAIASAYYVSWNATSIRQFKLGHGRTLSSHFYPYTVSTSPRPHSHPIAHLPSFHPPSRTEHSCQEDIDLSNRHGSLQLPHPYLLPSLD